MILEIDPDNKEKENMIEEEETSEPKKKKIIFFKKKKPLSEEDLKLKKTKTIVKTFIFIFVILGLILSRKQISDLGRSIASKASKVSKISNNKYTKYTNFQYFKTTNDFYIKNYEHLKQIFFTFINSGMDYIDIKCDNSYKDCLQDVPKLAKDKIEISYINAFVSPYNSFERIETLYDSLGRVRLINHKAYTDEEISILDKKVKSIVNQVISNKITDKKEIILKLHDYIVDNTKYDKNLADLGIENYKSDIAYGPLIEGYALCSGYADAMALFLDYYNIPNFKVVNEKHVWNAIKLKDTWYHLDLTWDDPIINEGIGIISHDYFLITDQELKAKDKGEHHYDSTIFKELKNSKIEEEKNKTN